MSLIVTAVLLTSRRAEELVILLIHIYNCCYVEQSSPIGLGDNGV